MSDDGYVADSPFEGGDDYYFWDDAASQDIADDLAERTMPSPVYLEDPAYEMMGGYSDWEYYSDDYYDDDPQLLKNNPQAGSPPAALRVLNDPLDSHAVRRRGRKRKLADAEDIPTLSLASPGLPEMVKNIGHDITGTTWKTETSSSETLYRQGEAKHVALLQDWRSVFRESQPKSDRRSTGGSKNRVALVDEWANDLSLADMGLMTATGKHISTNDIGNGYDDDDDDDDDEDDATDDEDGRPCQDGGSGVGNGEVPLDDGGDLPTTILQARDPDCYSSGTTIHRDQSPSQILPSRKRKKMGDEAAGLHVLDPQDDANIESQMAERMLSTPKRRKTSSVSSAAARPVRSSNITASASTQDSQASETQKHGRERPKKERHQLSDAQSMNLVNPENATADTAAASRPSKKRKAATEAAEQNQYGTTAATVSSRAKRIALNDTGLRNDGGSELSAPLPKPTTRDVRRRKK